MSYIMNQEENKILPAGHFVIEINSKNKKEIIICPIEEAMLEDPSYMVIGRYETEERTKREFVNLFSAITMQSTRAYRMPKEK